MAGNRDGARKAAETIKEKYGKDFFANIGALSWTDPDRSHETGFALLPPEERKRLGAEGGRKNKGKKYVKKVELTTAEEIKALLEEEDQDSLGPSIS